MSLPTFESLQRAWSSPPIDDIGYLPSAELLTWEPSRLLDLIREMEHNRYHGWRNYKNRWRDVLGLDTTTDKVVLDYGCGVGLEALQYARRGNEVVIADIVPENVKLALRVLSLHGFDVGAFQITPEIPIINLGYDVIHCNGVLHHIPEPDPIVEAFAGALNEEGELRLMVYSDEAWRIATHTEPPEGDVFDYEEFDQFWQHWDPIGGYADWYSCEKLRHRFGKWLKLVRCEPLTEHGEYLGAVMVKR